MNIRDLAANDHSRRAWFLPIQQIPYGDSFSRVLCKSTELGVAWPLVLTLMHDY